MSDDEGRSSSTAKRSFSEIEDGAATSPAKVAKVDVESLGELLAIDPNKIKNEADYKLLFDRIADTLLNNAIIHINDVPHRFIEIEFYYKGGAHEDFFAHCDEQQKTNGCWYFHRQNGRSFRAGTYKGVDLTIGCSEAFGGILVRSVQNISEGTIVEGPSLVVDHILNLNDAGSIDELVAGFDLKAVNGRSKLYVTLGSSASGVKYTREEFLTTPRVGLTLKKHDNNQPDFIMRHYRYLLKPSKIKKGKVHIVLSMLHSGKSVDQIFKLSGSPKKSIEKYVQLYRNAKSKTVKSFFGQQLGTDDICELYGLLSGPQVETTPKGQLALSFFKAAATDD